MTPQTLEELYKRHMTISHAAALEAVFSDGVRYAMESIKTRERDLEKSLEDLRDKYNALARKVAATESAQKTAKTAPVEKLTEQAMGMGKAMKK